MNISDEAVEAATKAVIAALSAMELGWVDTDTPDGVTIDVRDFNLTAAISAALESAAPILLSHEREETRLAHLDAVVNAQTVDRLEAELEQARIEAWECGRVDGYHHRPNPYKETK